MINSEIITIGDELIEGSRVNTNAAWLAKTLTKAGAKIKRIITVGDDPPLISSEIRRAIGEGTELTVTTGGLGPTNDDRTLEALSKALRVEREKDEKALQMIEESYARLARKGAITKEGLTPARRKMAKLPKNSEPIPNPVGGAPAVLTEKGKQKILCLPGVPEEMKAILKQELDRLGLKESGEAKNYRIIEVRGIEESALAPLYDKVEEKFPTAEVRSYPSGLGAKGKIRVKISCKNEKNLSDIEGFFRRLLKDLGETK